MYLCSKTESLLETKDEADYEIKVETCTNIYLHLLYIIISCYLWKLVSNRPSSSNVC